MVAGTADTDQHRPGEADAGKSYGGDDEVTDDAVSRTAP
jgi:hypothetical protein